MSYEIGIDTIHLRQTPRVAHTEYCSNAALKRCVAPNSDPHAAHDRLFVDAWQYDWLWQTDDGPVDWSRRGRTTDMGHSAFVEGGTDLRLPRRCPFHDAEQVFEFDAVQEYGLPALDELATYYEKRYRQQQTAHPNQVVPGGYYKTMMSGAIESFGWEMLLTAAADRDRFERVLDSFFRLSAHHFKAWAQTSIEVFNCHDDIVWTEGPFLSGAFYRRAIFPRYAELWSMLKQAGKRVLFTSDGNYTMFVEDLASAGADGFVFEPVTHLETVVQKFGRSHVIVSSKVDCRTLTFGTHDEIRREIDATLDLAFDCPGFMFAVGNHIPSNVPIDNALFFFDYLQRNWYR